MKWYGKSLSLRHGVYLTVFLTVRCNQHCKYCPMYMPSEDNMQCEESTLEQWKEFIRGFTKIQKVKEVSIDGGEPSLIPYIADLANWCLNEGYHVIIYSNLWQAERFQQIKQSYRFKIHATFHHQDKPDRFLKQYNLLISKYRVDVDEIDDGKPKVFPFSNIKAQYKKDFLRSHGIGWRIRPDRMIFTNCWDMYATTKVQPPLSDVK